MLEFVVNDKYDKHIIKDILMLHYNMSSRTIIKIKTLGDILLNDIHINVNQLVNKNDIIKIILPKEDSKTIISTNIPIDIVYEDEDIFIINKLYCVLYSLNLNNCHKMPAKKIIKSLIIKLITSVFNSLKLTS